MSALSSVSAGQPRPSRAATTPKRHLRPVDAPARRRRPRTVYGLTAVIGVVLIIAAQLFFSIASTQTTHRIVDLTEQQRSLTVQSQALFDQVAGLSSPQYLAANATAAGMVVGGSPTYLRLSDGAMIGTASADAVSTIDARGRAAVGNDLIANTPLVTDPSSTLSGQTAPVTTTGDRAADTDTGAVVAQEPPAAADLPQQPPALSEGLPTPETH